ncbi:MAG: NAD-dependent epimerase/dehydratase family protein [Actinomycetota bacterium]|nr:NAD-dependent epimerase/dehydratase family protein [Actinomycetota bacterium]
MAGRMLAAGYDVVLLDMRPPQRTDVAYRYVDVLDLGAMVHATRDIDTVFHLAGISDASDALARPVSAVQVNVAGAANVFEASRRNGVRRTVLASTAWVYAGAHGDAPIDEEVPFHLPSAGHIYTSSKITEELIAHNYCELYGTPFTILRYGDVYGPGMSENFVIPRFVSKALEGETNTVHGDGSQFRNYVYVDDLADAHLAALSDKAENEVFNLKGPEPITIRRIAEEVRDLLGAAFTIERGPLSSGDYEGRVISGEKAKRVLHWEAKTPFPEGLRRYVDWFTQKTSLAARPGAHHADPTT